MVEHIVQQIIDHKRIMNTTPKNMNELYNKINSCGVVRTGVWIGIHPCAYVECSDEFLKSHLNEYNIVEGLHVHGGVTFYGDPGTLKAFEFVDVKDTMVFGWDYGHCDDWAGYWSDEQNEMYGNRKWTVEEIEFHCKDAINQYLEII